MNVAVERWVDAARDAAAEHAERIRGRWSERTEPHARRILADSAVVAIRAVAGEDVTTATQALELSMTSLAREEKAFLLLEGRAVALRAALFVLQAAIP
jgi:hypothetical protein